MADPSVDLSAPVPPASPTSIAEEALREPALTPEQEQKMTAFREEAKDTSFLSALLEGSASGVSFGVTDAVGGLTSSGSYEDYMLKKRARKEAQPFATLLGEFGAPLVAGLITGGTHTLAGLAGRSAIKTAATEAAATAAYNISLKAAGAAISKAERIAAEKLVQSAAMNAAETVAVAAAKRALTEGEKSAVRSAASSIAKQKTQVVFENALLRPFLGAASQATKEAASYLPSNLITKAAAPIRRKVSTSLLRAVGRDAASAAERSAVRNLVERTVVATVPQVLTAPLEVGYYTLGQAARESIMSADPQVGEEYLRAHLGEDILTGLKWGGGLGLVEGSLPSLVDAASKTLRVAKERVPVFGRLAKVNLWTRPEAEKITGVAETTAKYLYENKEELDAAATRWPEKRIGIKLFDIVRSLEPEDAEYVVKNADQIGEAALRFSGPEQLSFLAAIRNGTSTQRAWFIENADRLASINRKRNGIVAAISQSFDRAGTAFNDGEASRILDMADNAMLNRDAFRDSITQAFATKKAQVSAVRAAVTAAYRAAKNDEGSIFSTFGQPGSPPSIGVIVDSAHDLSDTLTAISSSKHKLSVDEKVMSDLRSIAKEYREELVSIAGKDSRRVEPSQFAPSAEVFAEYMAQRAAADAPALSAEQQKAAGEYFQRLGGGKPAPAPTFMQMTAGVTPEGVAAVAEEMAGKPKAAPSVLIPPTPEEMFAYRYAGLPKPPPNIVPGAVEAAAPVAAEVAASLPAVRRRPMRDARGRFIRSPQDISQTAEAVIPSVTVDPDTAPGSFLSAMSEQAIGLAEPVVVDTTAADVEKAKKIAQLQRDVRSRIGDIVSQSNVSVLGDKYTGDTKRAHDVAKLMYGKARNAVQSRDVWGQAGAARGAIDNVYHEFQTEVGPKGTFRTYFMKKSTKQAASEGAKKKVEVDLDFDKVESFFTKFDEQWASNADNQTKAQLQAVEELLGSGAIRTEESAPYKAWHSINDMMENAVSVIETYMPDIAGPPINTAGMTAEQIAFETQKRTRELLLNLRNLSSKAVNETKDLAERSENTRKINSLLDAVDKFSDKNRTALEIGGSLADPAKDATVAQVSGIGGYKLYAALKAAEAVDKTLRNRWQVAPQLRAMVEADIIWKQRFQKVNNAIEDLGRFAQKLKAPVISGGRLVSDQDQLSPEEERQEIEKSQRLRQQAAPEEDDDAEKAKRLMESFGKDEHTLNMILRSKDLASDPIKFAQNMEDAGKHVAGYLPETFTGVSAGAQRLASEIASIFPDIDESSDPSSITADQASKLARVRAISSSPELVVKKVTDGTVTKDDIAVLDRLYPNMAMQMRSMVSDKMDALVKQKAPVPFATLCAAERFIGRPIAKTTSASVVRAAQAVYSGRKQLGGAGPMPAGMSAQPTRVRGASHLDLAGRLMTDKQKSEGRNV